MNQAEPGLKMERSNQINDDYIYYGNIVDRRWYVRIVNQDGERQLVKYTKESIEPHKSYLYNSNKLRVYDEDGQEVSVYDVTSDPVDQNGNPSRENT